MAKKKQIFKVACIQLNSRQSISKNLVHTKRFIIEVIPKMRKIFKIHGFGSLENFFQALTFIINIWCAEIIALK